MTLTRAQILSCSQVLSGRTKSPPRLVIQAQSITTVDIQLELDPLPSQARDGNKTRCHHSESFMPFLLELPVELRLVIYKLFLSELQDVSTGHQPRNEHFNLLHVCRQISYEAGHLADFRSYISLLHEDQIVAFIANIDIEGASRITTADVANDSRMVHASGNVRGTYLT
jgi:hypothetical protein